ncbi:site-specific DNA-methyltransferase [Rhizobium leguminosarum]|uniref:site-specific DNA-methyltransferase n=1 Tax=Rhizobium leguminosarum TaxID=384 RepID=UPI0003650DF7|nr:DNA methyltransferase [Rhizobium leguminosarum]
MNRLYFGDNLDVLRERIQPETVDLVYLDPPFNSNANYNILFKETSGAAAQAQAEAFRDTWEWGETAASSYEDVMRSSGDVALALKGLKSWIGQNDMMAYLAMMTARLLELRDILKPTGSLYLHCDPNASHYLKIILDALFGPSGFRSEISWRRQSAHNDAKQGRRQYGNVRDTLLFYTKSDKWKWNTQYTPYDDSYIRNFYKHIEPETGRLYRLSDLTGPGGAAKGNPFYEVMGVKRHWRFSRERMDLLIAEGRIVQTRPGAVPAQKRYLDEMPGVSLQNDWSDIRPASGKEALGYPTQKPLSLLERIIRASTDPGDVVLDPFCGCGTTVEAAERTGRQWIGIDVTHYAITLIEARLKSNHPHAEFTVHGRPVDLASARDLARRDKHQFQWWAAWRLGSQTYREEKKGADRGIDGNILFKNGPYGDGRIIVSVKGGEHIGSQMVRDLRGVVEREEAEMGIMVCLSEPTGPMLREANDAGFVTRSAHGRLPRLQIATIQDILDGRLPKMPPLPAPERKLTPSIKRRDRDQLELLLPFPGEKIISGKGTMVDPRFLSLSG